MNDDDKQRARSRSDDEDISPFAGLTKSTVLQECSASFNDPDVVTKHPRRCCRMITSLLYLMSQGETFSSSEASEVFFGVTKLFQSDDLNLRRMVYLFIKEVAESTDSGEIIIVTQSLTKDMNCSVDLFRANAIRVLCKIIDASMLGQIDRYIKQAIVDRNALVSSAALVSGAHLVGAGIAGAAFGAGIGHGGAREKQAERDIIRRWVNEVQEAVHARPEMVQFHALALLYEIKRHDKLAVSKLVTQLTRASPKSPLGMCLLIRYTSKLLNEDLSATNARAAYEFLEGCLRHKNELVIYEAARAMCGLPSVAARDLAPAVTVLQLFLSSPKPTLRFAAVRTLNQVAQTHPSVVVKCNDDMEALISDSNRSIATLAITTLLKTGSEGSIDRLLKQISNFMGEIADEFKIVVVHAIRTLCLKYPAKYRTLLGFLSSVLREEGGFEFKKAIVDSVLELMDRIPETKESGLFHMCEFIEDCEFTQLSTQILHVLGEEGPKTAAPAKYIRFIYNRIILENAHVRAAAVCALAKFGAKVPALVPSLVVLLERCQKDDDDEVRDRASLCLNLLRREIESGAEAHGDGSANPDGAPAPDKTPGGAYNIIAGGLPIDVKVLAKSLELYQMRPADGPVTFASLPAVADTVDLTTAQLKEQEAEAAAEAQRRAGSAGGAALLARNAAEELYKIPQFSRLGPLFKSSRPSELSESETEYVVAVVKHMFSSHCVFQFTITNTLSDQLLEKVTVDMDPSEPDMWEVESVVMADKLPYDCPKHVYVCMRRNTELDDWPSSSFVNELKFVVRDLDPESGEPASDDEGYDELYPLEDIEVTAADFIAKTAIPDFRTAWEATGDGAEALEKFQLSQFKSLPDAVPAVIDFLGMQPCEGTAIVQDKARGHMLLLSGMFLGGLKVLVRTHLSCPQGDGTVLKIAVRSGHPSVSQAVLECIR